MTFRRNLISSLALTVLCATHWATALAAAGPTYTPMVIEDYEGYSNGAAIDPTWTTRSFVDSSRPLSGTKSGVIKFKNNTGGQVGNFYGFEKQLGGSVGIGETVWYRAYFYFPSTVSLNYHNGSGDGGDGWGYMKFLALKGSAGVLYTQLASLRRLDYGDPNFANTTFASAHDFGIPSCTNMGGVVIPRDRWVAIQVAHHLQTTGNGMWTRIWMDDTFVGECAQNQGVTAGYSIYEWKLGNYINGGGHIQGGSTDTFWIDDVVITKQTPNTTDSGGRPYIHSTHFTGGGSAPPPLAAPNPPSQIN